MINLRTSDRKTVGREPIDHPFEGRTDDLANCSGCGCILHLSLKGVKGARISREESGHLIGVRWPSGEIPITAWEKRLTEGASLENINAHLKPHQTNPYALSAINYGPSSKGESHE